MRIEYRAGYKYQLTKTVTVQTRLRPSEPIVTTFLLLTTDGLLTIMAGYAWDGLSGAPDLKSAMPGSLVHDAIYQMIRMRLLPASARADADQVFGDIMEDDGTFAAFRWVAQEAVEMFGGPSADPANRKPVLIAP